MSHEFIWPEAIPIGQRNYNSPSSVIRKNVNTIHLSFPDKRKIELFSNIDLDETIRRCIIYASVGIFSGVRNALHGGLVLAAKTNAPDVIKPTTLKRDEGEFANTIVDIDWVSDSKNPITISTEQLMSLTYTLSDILNPN